MVCIPHRTLTIVAQDPGVKKGGKILTARAEVPFEDIEAGPTGYRVKVVDIDSTNGVLYTPFPSSEYKLDGEPDDPFSDIDNNIIETNPNFHAQNVYAIVMRTLARFEYALGRRVNWSFDGHQIHLAPHAFADANAFYARDERGILFGYFPGRQTGKTVFTCLSHDVVAHETTHALLDGLRERYVYPSSPDQAAFHEGFSDVVALLSVFSLREVVEYALDHEDTVNERVSSKLIDEKYLKVEALRRTFLTGMAEQMGQEISSSSADALRRSVELTPSDEYLKSREFEEPHRRGEVLVAAMINAFLGVWVKRLGDIGYIERKRKNRAKVVEEGVNAADHLLTMSIRALDYSPATDLEFGDYLSALLTADYEMYPDDSKYMYREILLESFESYGIKPASKRKKEVGIWDGPDQGLSLDFDSVHFDSMRRDKDEVFKFIWENRNKLGIAEDAYTRVLTVLPCLRIATDGFVLVENVAQYVQMMTLRANELGQHGIEIPKEMSGDQSVTLYGGGALIFDEFGRLKYHVHNYILNEKRQSKRLDNLFKSGYFERRFKIRDFADLHRRRLIGSRTKVEGEVW